MEYAINRHQKNLHHLMFLKILNELVPFYAFGKLHTNPMNCVAQKYFIIVILSHFWYCFGVRYMRHHSGVSKTRSQKKQKSVNTQKVWKTKKSKNNKNLKNSDFGCNFLQIQKTIF